MSIDEQIKAHIEKAIPDAKTEIISSGRHFSITVISAVFEGKSPLAKQQLVYSSIAPLMSGADAPVHAVDTLKTLVPAAQ